MSTEVLSQLLADQRAARDEVREIRLLLTDAIAEMRAMRRDIERHETDDDRLHDDHEKRLRAQERRLWLMALAAVVLGTGGGAGVASLLTG